MKISNEARVYKNFDRCVCSKIVFQSPFFLSFSHNVSFSGCVGTHAFSGIWSLLAAGIFIKKDTLAGAIQLGSVGDGLIHVC